MTSLAGQTFRGSYQESPHCHLRLISTKLQKTAGTTLLVGVAKAWESHSRSSEYSVGLSPAIIPNSDYGQCPGLHDHCFTHMHAWIDGHMLSLDLMLKRWLKGLTHSKGIRWMITPAQCLMFVLVILNKPPFKPLETTSLKHLTWTTVFLLPFTFTWCASEMHVLNHVFSCALLDKNWEYLVVIRPLSACSQCHKLVSLQIFRSCLHSVRQLGCYDP